MAVLLEFFNQNSHRYYPFDATNTVPTALLIGMGVIATSGLPDNSIDNGPTTYISKIVTDGTHIRFYLSMDVSGTVTEFGCVATVEVGSTQPVRTDFQYVGSEAVFEGFIVTGDTTVATRMPPVTTLDKDTGKIHTTCIQHMNNWVAGIRVGDKVYGGIVSLEAGPGVSLSASGNTIVISCTGAIPPDNSIIQNDQDIFDSLVDAYGAPITHINGVPCGGDWSIVVNASEGLTVTPDATTNSITIHNTLASVCCTQDQISVLVDNISALNERCGVLNSFVTQVDTGVNVLSAQMTKVL